MRNKGSVKYCTLYTVIPIAPRNQKRGRVRVASFLGRGGRLPRRNSAKVGVGRSRREFAGDTPATTREGGAAMASIAGNGDSPLSAKRFCAIPWASPVPGYI